MLPSGAQKLEAGAYGVLERASLGLPAPAFVQLSQSPTLSLCFSCLLFTPAHTSCLSLTLSHTTSTHTCPYLPTPEASHSNLLIPAHTFSHQVTPTHTCSHQLSPTHTCSHQLPPPFTCPHLFIPAHTCSYQLPPLTSPTCVYLLSLVHQFTDVYIRCLLLTYSHLLLPSPCPALLVPKCPKIFSPSPSTHRQGYTEQWILKI